MQKRMGFRVMWRWMAVLAVLSGASCNSGAPTPGSGPNAFLAAQAKATNDNDASVKPKRIEKRIGVPEDTVAVDIFPVDLSKYYHLRAEHFEKVTRFPWKIVPQGRQTFAGILLQLDGAMFLWGEQNTKNGTVFPERIEGIPIEAAFETLYIYHSGFFEGQSGDPVYDVVFQYEDGNSAKEPITSGEDLLDWYVNDANSPKQPSGPRSTVAWSGADENGQVVRYCLTAMQNPHPVAKVKSLDLVSAKGPTAGCILGLTVGRSGLLKIANKEVPTAK
jgi:hypothetical protein